MRKFLLLFVGVLLECFPMYAGRGLGSLAGLYSFCQGEPKYWVSVYKKTNDFVKSVLKQDTDLGEISVLDNGDLIALWAFLHNERSLGNFLESDYFFKNRKVYILWLVDLFHLAYRVALGFNKTFVRAEVYERALNEYDIAQLRGSGLNKEIADIISEHIDWGD